MKEQQLDIAPALQNLLDEQNQKLNYVQTLEDEVNKQTRFLDKLEETLAYYLDMDITDMVFTKVKNADGNISVEVSVRGSNDPVIKPESILDLITYTILYIEDRLNIIQKERKLFYNLVSVVFDFNNLSDEEREKVELQIVDNSVKLSLKV